MSEIFERGAQKIKTFWSFLKFWWTVIGRNACTLVDRLKLTNLNMKHTEKPFDVKAYFLDILQKDRSLSAGIAAIKTLLTLLEKSKLNTVQELQLTIESSVSVMRSTEESISSVVSGCELFSRFITLGKFDDKPMEECKQIMVQRGQTFLKKLSEARHIIARQGAQFVIDGCKVLTHSRSRVVLETLKLASKMHKRFHVYVTKSSPDDSGVQMIEDLQNAGIECTLILDSSIGYIMENIDFVLCGAEGVVESGGIVNKIGTFTMAVCAREMKKPVYVLTESFKFTRLYPLNQRDLPNDYKYPRKCLAENYPTAHPLVDYTPPAYITLIFTDLGILTPSAVSDELIKLYL